MDIGKIVCHEYLLTLWPVTHGKINSLKGVFLYLKDNASVFMVLDSAQKYKCEKAKENDCFFEKNRDKVIAVFYFDV